VDYSSCSSGNFRCNQYQQAPDVFSYCKENSNNGVLAKGKKVVIVCAASHGQRDTMVELGSAVLVYDEVS
jgi:hypothetical protein